jgi:hypothetical protein
VDLLLRFHSQESDHYPVFHLSQRNRRHSLHSNLLAEKSCCSEGRILVPVRQPLDGLVQHHVAHCSSGRARKSAAGTLHLHRHGQTQRNMTNVFYTYLRHLYILSAQFSKRATKMKFQTTVLYQTFVQLQKFLKNLSLKESLKSRKKAKLT